jgi:hypothetical protein
MIIQSFPRFFLSSAAIVTFLCLGLVDPACANLEDHITRTESGFYYTIQEGDTLWDLSQQFADSPWEWPELWRYNPEIPNPHLIYPGRKLLIYKKEWEDRDKQEQIVSVLDPPAAIDEPLPAKKPDPFYEYSEIDGLGFIRPAAIPSMGTIFRAQDDVNLITAGNTVFIDPASDGPRPAVGDRLFAFHTIDPVRDPVTRDIVGVQHVLTGIVDIIRIEEGLAVGRVFKAFREISLQDQVTAYWQREKEIFFRDYPPNVTAKVIKAHDGQGIIAQNMIVFIDKGLLDGIAVGDVFDIFHHESAKTDPGKYRTVDLPPEHVGQLLVLHTEEETATAIIRDSKKSITPGDQVGSLLP